MHYDTIAFMETLLLQLASPQDIECLSALENSIFSLPWSSNALREAMQSGKEFWIAYLDDEPVGYCGIFNTIDTVEILNMGVLAAARGRGIGARLLHQAILRGRVWGCEKVCLEVRESNQQARYFYEHQGFKVLGLRKQYYPPIDPGSVDFETAVIMVYFLDN